MSEQLTDRIANLKQRLAECTDKVRFALSMGDIFVYDSLMSEQLHLRKTIMFWQEFEQQITLPHTTILDEDAHHDTEVMVSFHEWRYQIPQHVTWVVAPDLPPQMPHIETLTLPHVKVMMRMSRLIDMDNPVPLVRGIMDFYLREVSRLTGKRVTEILDIMQMR